MQHFLQLLSYLVLKKTRLVLISFGFGTVFLFVSLFFTFEIQTDVASLLPKQNKAAQEFASIMKLLGHQDTLFLLAEGKREDLISFADALVPKLLNSAYVEQIDYNAKQSFYPFFEKVVLEYLFFHFPAEKIPELLKKLTPAAIRKKIAQNFKKLFSADPAIATRINIDPLGFAEALMMEMKSRQKNPFDLESGYLLAANQKALLIKIKGKYPATRIYESIALVEFIRQQTQIVCKKLPVQVEFAGGYSVAVSNYNEFRRDLTVTLISSISAVLFIIYFVFREKLLIFLIGLPLHLAILWTFAIGSFLLSPLTSISLAFAAILAGLGIDFAIHFYQRFTQECAEKSIEEAMTQTFLSTGKSIITAGITSSCGFLVFYATEFKGFAELGLMSGIGIFICLLFMLLCFPALLVSFSTKEKTYQTISLGTWSFYGLKNKYPLFFLTLLLTVLSLIILFAFQEKGVPFQSNINILRPKEQTRFQEKLKAYFKETNVCYVVHRAKSRGELLKQAHLLKQHLQKMQKQNIITHYRSVAELIPLPETQHKIQQKLHQLKAEEIAQTLKAAFEKYGFKTHPTSETFPFAPNKESYDPYLRWLSRILKSNEILTLENLETPELKTIQESFIRTDKNQFVAIAYLFPQQELNDRKTRQKFLQQIESYLPKQFQVTGLPILLFHLEELIVRSFSQAVSYSLVCILIFSFLHFRSRAAIFALLPMVLGCLWMFAILKVLNIPLNFMNIVVVPMIIGLGIDDGIHFVARFLEHRDLKTTLTETGSAIALTSATTLAGFGSLLFANNAGLVSIGALACCGIIACFVVSLFILPILLSFIPLPQESKKTSSGDTHELV